MKLLHSFAGLCVLALALAGCSQEASVPAETMLRMPASPPPAAASAEVPSEEDGPAEPGGRSTDQQETDLSTSVPSDHCVIVAGGVTTAMLAPWSFRSGSDPADLVSLEQQILDLREKVPADLHDDFTTLAHSVEAQPKGSGRFDEEAFRRAMVPVEHWLGQHCARH